MKKVILYMAALCAVAASCTKMEYDGTDAPAADAVEIPASAYQGELLIKFSPEMTDILDEAGLAIGPATRSGIPSTDEVLSILGAYSFERIFPVDPASEENTRKAGLHLWYTVKFEEGTDLTEAVARLSRLGEISNVQYNAEIKRSYRTDDKPFVVSSSLAIPAASQPFNDEYLPYQWHYINEGGRDFEKEWAKTLAGSDVGCEEAWKKCTGNPEIIVAVLDEGVMFTHPDLAANMWVNTDDQGNEEHLFAGEDVDGNGYKDDRYGYNFVTNNGIISVDGPGNVGHGTHVAGTIAAVNGNGKGVCGIAGGAEGKPGVRIMSCQLFDGNRGASVSASAKAIKYAADNGAVILQCSWGLLSADSDPMYYPIKGPATDEEWTNLAPLEKDAIDYFVRFAGSPNGVIEGGIPIFASGNEYAAISSYPAAYSKCLSVSAIAADYTPSTYTNFGTEVDFCAPGGDHDYYGTPGADRVGSDIASAVDMHGGILSTLAVEGRPAYGYMEGTSMACPHVSGVAALGLSYAYEQHRHFKAEEFIQLMKETAADVDQYYTKDKKYHFQSFLNGTRMTKMNTRNYRGKMGRLAKADALLRAIADGAGADMKLPNIYLAAGVEKQIALDRYFQVGAKTFTCSGNDNSIADATVEGNVLTVKGVKEGFTELVVKAGTETQKIIITVRNDASEDGWL